MTRHLSILIVLVATSFVLLGQDTTRIEFGYNIYFIKEKGKPVDIISDCLFCNADIMSDRVVLDSTKTMITRKTSNPLGYIYQEWRSSTYKKTYEVIRLVPLNFMAMSSFSDAGEPLDQWIDCLSTYSILYSDNHQKTVKRVRVHQSTQATDSLVKTYSIPQEKIMPGTRFWTEVNFNDNGKISSSGIMITGLKGMKTNENKVGTWLYYNTAGLLSKTETLTSLTSSTDK